MEKTVREIFILGWITVAFSPALLFAETIGPEPRSWSFPAIVEHAREINQTNIEGKPFNRYGLAYSSEELDSITLSELDPKELQNYADIVTHAFPDAVAKRLPTDCSSIAVEELNQTAVAGIAYISINAIGEQTKRDAENCLKIVQQNLKKVGR